MPKGLSEDGEARWLLCRASVWPDQIRTDRENQPSYPPQPAKQGSYHRGVWHYIDTPLVIVATGTGADQVKALEEKARAAQDLAADAPAAETDVKNVLQAIAFNRQRLAHGKPAGTSRRPLLVAAHARRYPPAAARDGRVFRRMPSIRRPTRTAMQAATASAWPASGICTPFGMPRPMPIPNRRMTLANRSISATIGPTAGR